MFLSFLRGGVGVHRMQIATMQVAEGAEVQGCQNVKCEEKKYRVQSRKVRLHFVSENFGLYSVSLTAFYLN